MFEKIRTNLSFHAFMTVHVYHDVPLVFYFLFCTCIRKKEMKRLLQVL